jgi:hypothetical protein
MHSVGASGVREQETPSSHQGQNLHSVGLASAWRTLNENNRKQSRHVCGFSLCKVLGYLLWRSTQRSTCFHSLQLRDIVALLDAVYVGLESELQGMRW